MYVYRLYPLYYQITRLLKYKVNKAVYTTARTVRICGDDAADNDGPAHLGDAQDGLNNHVTITILRKQQP